MNERLIKRFMILFVIVISSLILPGLITSFRWSAAPKSKLTFMTYNIHFSQGRDDLLNLERIAQNILIDDPDIIGLQEVEVGRVTSQGVDMAYWLANRLGMYYYYANPSTNIHLMGNAILSKYPIVLQEVYDLPSILQERLFIHCVVEVNSSLKIDVFCTHIGIRTENKSAQIDFLLEKITEISATPKRVLMGDFNLENTTAEIINVLSYFNDTATEFGATYRAPIDYIFATGYQNIMDYHVITDMLSGVDSPAEFGSDHLPVVSIIDFS
jgi:endonuclease/exonuclease/phosphatase family metal-dependent hydrolase